MNEYKKRFKDLGIPMIEYTIIYYDSSGKNIFEIIYPSPYPPEESTIKNIASSEALIYTKSEVKWKK